MNRYLTEYIEHKNMWSIFYQDEDAIDPANITPKQARKLLDEIEYDLSPENLSCDGELRGAQLQAKKLRLLEAKKALEKASTERAD